MRKDLVVMDYKPGESVVLYDGASDSMIVLTVAAQQTLSLPSRMERRSARKAAKQTVIPEVAEVQSKAPEPETPLDVPSVFRQDQFAPQPGARNYWEQTR